MIHFLIYLTIRLFIRREYVFQGIVFSHKLYKWKVYLILWFYYILFFQNEVKFYNFYCLFLEMI